MQPGEMGQAIAATCLPRGLERWTEPAEQIVSAFMDYQFGAVDKKKSAMRRKGVDDKGRIEREPSHHGPARQRLPGLFLDGSEILKHLGDFYLRRADSARKVTNVWPVAAEVVFLYIVGS